MRRIVTALVAVAATGVVGVSAAMVLTNSANGPSTSATERLADGVRYIVSSPGASTAPTQYTNSCPPAQAAACEQIVLSVTGVVVQGVAYSVITFTTN